MNKNVNKKHSRRGFLSLGLLGGAAFVARGTDTTSDRDEMVPMLTPDGKLVEVPGSVLARSQKRKTNNTGILNWLTNQFKAKH